MEEEKQPININHVPDDASLPQIEDPIVIELTRDELEYVLRWFLQSAESSDKESANLFSRLVQLANDIDSTLKEK